MLSNFVQHPHAVPTPGKMRLRAVPLGSTETQGWNLPWCFTMSSLAHPAMGVEFASDSLLPTQFPSSICCGDVASKRHLPSCDPASLSVEVCRPKLTNMPPCHLTPVLRVSATMARPSLIASDIFGFPPSPPHRQRTESRPSGGCLIIRDVAVSPEQAFFLS